MGDIPLAYDFYIDGMIEDMQNDPRPKHPEDIDRAVQQLRDIVGDLVDMLSDANINWSHGDRRTLSRIRHRIERETNE